MLYGCQSNFFDYCDERRILYYPEQFGKTIEAITENINKAYYYHKERNEFVVEPEKVFSFGILQDLKTDLFLSFSSFVEWEEKIELDFEEVREFQEMRIGTATTDSIKTTFHPVEALKTVIKENSGIYRFLIVALKRHQCEKLKELFKLNSIEVKGIVKDFEEFEKKAKKGDLYLTAGRPITGFKNFSEAIFVITEEEIFGIQGKKREAKKKSISETISTIYELKEGDLAVHLDHGIGIFRGLKQVSVLGKMGEYIELEYADNGKLFVPVEKINLIQKYIASEDYIAKIDRLGEKRWQKVKKKAKEDLKKWAEEIVKTEALRRTKEGFAFPIDTAHLEEFSATFEYEETEDQQKAIDEVLSDMEQKRPMDRIVCGDVGFGKTEVAIRAAFVACEAKKQVAVIAPTTVLAEQHYEVFKRRFQSFGYKVEILS
ncbi:MAG: DEAD/DEAH box helicase, partial [Candidatus Omnitrophica bacterium]|nr:DEAD/DEAH box helicase [Candidatus Omnitrophota bacterium]